MADTTSLTVSVLARLNALETLQFGNVTAYSDTTTFERMVLARLVALEINKFGAGAGVPDITSFTREVLDRLTALEGGGGAPVAPSLSSPAALDGTALVGQKLFVDDFGAATGTVSYVTIKWYNENGLITDVVEQGLQYTAVGQPTYTIYDTEVGHTIRAGITPWNAAGPIAGSEVFTPYTSAVAAISLSSDAPVISWISGTTDFDVDVAFGADVYDSGNYYEHLQIATDYGFGFIAGVAISSITYSGTTNELATVTTASAHGLTNSSVVTIAGATPSAYNVTGVQITVQSSTTFTYGMASNPGANASVVGSYTYSSIVFDGIRQFQRGDFATPYNADWSVASPPYDSTQYKTSNGVFWMRRAVYAETPAGAQIVSPWSNVLNNSGAGPTLTWNPGDTSNDFVLSNGNLTLTATSSGTTNGGISRTTRGFSGSVKVYWEVNIGTSGNNPFLGVCNNSIADGLAGSPTSQSTNGIFIDKFADVYYNNANSGGGISFAAGDKLMFAVDYANGLFWFGKNGTWTGSPSAGTGGKSITALCSGTIFPVYYNDKTSSGSCTGVFASGSFTYAIPTGFTAIP